jgi:hypothetical protein
LFVDELHGANWFTYIDICKLHIRKLGTACEYCLIACRSHSCSDLVSTSTPFIHLVSILTCLTGVIIALSYSSLYSHSPSFPRDMSHLQPTPNIQSHLPPRLHRQPRVPTLHIPTAISAHILPIHRVARYRLEHNAFAQLWILGLAVDESTPVAIAGPR